MALNTKLVADYMEMFDGYIFNFPDNFTLDMRQRIINALSGFLDEPTQRTDDQFEDMLTSLQDCWSSPDSYVANRGDDEEFISLLKNRVTLAIDYFKNVSDDEFQELIDEKLNNRKESRQTQEKLAAKVPPKKRYDEALEMLNQTLESMDYNELLRAQGKEIRDIIRQIIEQNNVSWGEKVLPDYKVLENVLTATNAVIITPTIEKALALQTALEQIDGYKNNNKLQVAAAILLGVVLLLVGAGLIATASGAFVPLGLVAFPVILMIMGDLIGFFLVVIGNDEIKKGCKLPDQGDKMTTLRQGFFKINTTIVAANHSEVHNNIDAPPEDSNLS